VPGAPNSPAGTAGEPTFQVFGWSKGYVGFTVIPVQPTAAQESAGTYVQPVVVASNSSDGVHWNVGKKLDLAAAGSTMLMNFRTVMEGPHGLLAVGWTGACGDEILDSLWTSADGIEWKPVNAGKVFGATPVQITRISGGAAGFVAVAYKGAGAWTSQDGRTWQPVALKGTAFKDSLVDDGTAIGSSYMLAGITGIRDCTATVSDGSATPKPVLRTASVWWSADGSAWTRVSLPGAVAKSENQEMWVSHLSNRAVMVVDATDPKSFAWGTHDGRTWTQIALPAGIYQQGIVSDGRHNLFLAWTGQDITHGDISKLYTIDDNFSSTAIIASGDVPDIAAVNYYDYGIIAVGPAGVVVTKADGSQMWLGVPSAE
jgi:hypothetical protein